MGPVSLVHWLRHHLGRSSAFDAGKPEGPPPRQLGIPLQPEFTEHLRLRKLLQVRNTLKPSGGSHLSEESGFRYDSQYRQNESWEGCILHWDQSAWSVMVADKHWLKSMSMQLAHSNKCDEELGQQKAACCLFLSGLRAKAGFYIFLNDWKKITERRLIFCNTWKLLENHILVSINSFTGMQPGSCAYGCLWLLPGGSGRAE